jgi:hypothetical protein
LETENSTRKLERKSKEQELAPIWDDNEEQSYRCLEMDLAKNNSLKKLAPPNSSSLKQGALRIQLLRK